MIDLLDVSVPFEVRLPSAIGSYHAWRKKLNGGWRLVDRYGNPHTVVYTEEIAALAEPLRPWWPAPAVLPFTDQDGDQVDLDEHGRLRRTDGGSFVYVWDVPALAAAIAAHRGGHNLNPRAP